MYRTIEASPSLRLRLRASSSNGLGAKQRQEGGDDSGTAAKCSHERARVRQLSARSREPPGAPLGKRRAPQMRTRRMSGGGCVSAQTGVAVQGATRAGWRAWG